MHNKLENMKLLLEKANESLEVAKSLFEDGHYGFSASRSYYAMFYATEAVLLHKDLQFSKHSAVLSYFNKEFVKEGIISSSKFKSLQKGFDLRLEGDYGLIPVEKEEGKNIMEEAQAFLQTIRDFLRKESYDL
ncbi:MAG: HEPN domain-containing protein [candidate division Zixibacteria bacterium]|nr:HEPN domain-containing protein [candidate division Zixibacteria bacterium]